MLCMMRSRSDVDDATLSIDRANGRGTEGDHSVLWELYLEPSRWML